MRSRRGGRSARPRARRVIALLTLVLLAPAAGREPVDVATWTPRLEMLAPERPRDYLELAEEIADAARDPESRALARRLFGLAGVLDPEGLGRSACLALADLADLDENDLERRRLLALASLLEGPTLLVAAGGVDAAAAPPEGAVLAVTEAFSYFRRGRGTKAINALREAGAMELLEANEPLLPAGGLHRFLEDCKAYRQSIPPNILERDLVRMLRLEAALLAGSQRSWSADLLLRDAQPLIEVDPAELSTALGVDGSRPLFRRGRWVIRGDDAAS